MDAIDAAADAEATEAVGAPDHPPPDARHHDPVVWGTILCVVSAVGYTATNVCLRDVAPRIDPFWVSCIKAAPTVLVAGLLVLGRARRGLSVTMSQRAFWALVAVAIIAQIGGNAAFQWTLQAVGMALAVPISSGTMMIAGAIAGRMVLGEAVTARAIAAMTILILAIVALSAGAGEASASIEIGAESDQSALRTAGGVALACFSGAAYALLSVTIRRVSRRELPVSLMLLVICGTGLVSLGAVTLLRIGSAGIANTSPRDWAVMLLAGAFNAVAFFALSRALALVSVVHVNLVSASQVAMAALVGVAWFGEAKTPALGAGVALTVLGLMVMRRR